ncbi:rho GDP-dissociation inhibitor 1-like [Limulus polyphemus]|uniref:Rho GDP-dissociation inhibitor 1-like n=1 Tax=Limulus polyphemus TaxID=6850 RepID=A0ABM1B778_LIMPO|nr:rho GDP-dissociation inhibitor 1-like [Limulus polyphemus]XP_022243492.1 rho GDP-dissociation inhibitor 1-like [Limulus polyphemus]XP_022243493.1 rho GDP-dissociation inhibitor 1-like [Limulus polyphemus]
MADNNSKEDTVMITEDEEEINYRPPAERTLQEIIEADHEDNSLKKYKETLLGQATKELVVVDPKNPGRVLVNSLSLIVDGRPNATLDLSGDLGNLNKRIFIVKEGIQYRIQIDFYVQREIVTGLKYVQRIMRHDVLVEKTSHMVGSYGPKLELQSFITKPEEMPSGMPARGKYTVKSLFTDDDKNEHLKWEWCFEIRKDWE